MSETNEQGPRVSVLMPTYGQAQFIVRAIESLLAQQLADWELIVVDDGSTDATADVARARGAAVLSFGENRGLREGIAAGYGYARDHGYAFVGRVDADGQHPVDELRRLLERVREGTCAVAVGARFATGDGYEAFRYEPTAARKLGTAVLRRAMHAALGRPFRDATSGMYAANAAAMPVLAEPYESGAPEVESLLRLRDAGLRILEIPVHMRERAGGESKLRGRRAVELVLTVAATLLLYRFLRRRRGGQG